MNEPKRIRTDRAPAAIGPYSQAVAADGRIWISGQIGLAPDSGRLVPGGVEAEARQALCNLAEILEAAGSSPRRVVKTTIYLIEMGDFEVVNRVYAETFGEHPPARACVEVAGLPKGARVEVDAVALS